MLGFVTQVAPVDTTIADEAWWQDQVAEIRGDWWCQEVETSCICCGTPVVIARWQTTSEGDQCNECIQLDCTPYEADEDEIADALSVKISF
jgi:hypothetical protein